MNKATKAQLERALGDPTVGPRPITIEEYRRRQAAKNSTPIIPPEVRPVKKLRSGVEAYFQRRLQEAQRALVLASNKEEKRLASQWINELKMQRTNYRIQKKENKMQK